MEALIIYVDVLRESEQDALLSIFDIAEICNSFSRRSLYNLFNKYSSTPDWRCLF